MSGKSVSSTFTIEENIRIISDSTPESIEIQQVENTRLAMANV